MRPAPLLGLRGIFLLVLSLSAQPICADGPATCFFFDGSEQLDHEPCIPASERNATTHSTCCILGNPVGNLEDICTIEGLCFAQRNTNSQQVLFQGGCTDLTFRDPICNLPCPPATNGTQFWVIKFCPNGEYCCNAPGDNYTGVPPCCTGSTFGLSLELSLQATSSAPQSTSSTTQFSSSTMQNISPAASCPAIGTTSSSNTTTSCPKNETVAVGASIGAVLGSMLLAALVMIFFLQRKLVQHRQLGHQEYELAGNLAENPTALQQGAVYEKDGNNPRHELPLI